MSDKVVYFARNTSSGLIKIGTTSNIAARLYGLRNPKKGVSHDIQLLVDTAGWRAKERAYHAHFNASRVEGEWFAPTPDILEEIELLKNGCSNLPELDNAQDVEWRNHATPDEIAEHDGLIAQVRANSARRKLIRNRCWMRGKQKANGKTSGKQGQETAE